MDKNRFIIQSDNNVYNILYFPNTFQIAKIEKDTDISKIDIPSYNQNATKLKELQLADGKVGITFMSARTCNLKCRYCYAGEGEYGDVDSKPKMLSVNMYMKAVKMVLEEYPEGIKSISFFGGEPLLNFKEISIFIPMLLKELDKRKIEYPSTAKNN